MVPVGRPDDAALVEVTELMACLLPRITMRPSEQVLLRPGPDQRSEDAEADDCQCSHEQNLREIRTHYSSLLLFTRNVFSTLRRGSLGCHRQYTGTLKTGRIPAL